MLKRFYFSSEAVKLLAITFIALIFLERPLEAYADPGSGLLMWQLLGAVVLGAMYQVRRVIQKLRTLTSNPKQTRPSEGVSRGAIVS